MTYYLMTMIAAVLTNPVIFARDVIRWDTGEVVYKVGPSVFYVKCQTPYTDLSRHCSVDAVRPTLSISETDYYKAMAIHLNVDPSVLKMGSADALNRRIEILKGQINDVTAAAEERSRGAELLAKLERNYPAAVPALNLIASFDHEENLNLDEHSVMKDAAIVGFKVKYPNFFQIIPKFVSDPNTGLAWAKIDDACWYDAMDQERPGGGDGKPCYSAEIHWIGNNISLREKRPALVHLENAKSVKLGCKRTLGKAWRLPSARDFTGPLVTDLNIEYDHYRFGSYTPLDLDGVTLSDGTIHGLAKYTHHILSIAYITAFDGGTFALDKKDPKLIVGPIACVAPAKVVDPIGDVDADGIVNETDQCNQLPKNRAAEIAREGNHIGCADGQKTDLEREATSTPQNPDQTSSSIDLAPWVNAFASRYVFYKVEDVKTVKTCTVPETGATGTRRYYGWFDPQFRQPNGKIGGWIRDKSQWTDCR